MAFSTRRAGASDLDAIVDLRIEFERITRDSPSFDEPARRAELRVLLGGDLNSGLLLAWLAEDEGRVVAQAALRLLGAKARAAAGAGADAVNGAAAGTGTGRLAGGAASGGFRSGEILNVYTLPAFRGRGIATALLALALGEARALGLSVIKLQPTEDSRRIYERAGFAAVGRGMALDLSPRAGPPRLDAGRLPPVYFSGPPRP